MYIAIEMKKLLEEKATVDAKTMANVPLRVFCKSEDSMCVADHMWLNELKAIEYKDAMRSGNEVLDAGMTAGTLLGENSDGVYVTNLETLLLSGNATNGKITVSFVGSLKDAMDIYKKSEKSLVRRPRKSKTETTLLTSVQKPVDKTEELLEDNVITDASFPMPEPQQESEESNDVVATVPVVDDNNPFSETNTSEVTPETQFPLKDQHDRSMVRNFDESGFPEGPEYEQFKKSAISHGVSSANVAFALTALQMSDTVEDLLHSLVVVYGECKTEAYVVYDGLKNYFSELKLLADQVIPFEIRV